MKLLLFGVEIGLAAFSSWTLAYHLCLALELPARAILLPFGLLLAAAAWPLGRDVGPAFAAARRERGHLAATLALGGAFGVLSLFLLFPNPDDLNFFHRALAQLSMLDEPFLAGDTVFNLAGLEAISPLHSLTSYELGVALGASALGLDPLGTYHNALPVLGSLGLAVTYVALGRELGLRPRAAWVCALGVFLFFFLDTRDGRSFAQVYRTLWLGKSLQWALLFPALVLVSWRYLEAPGLRRLLPVAQGGVCAVGLSGTGVFLAPALLLGCVVAHLAATRPREPRRIAQALALEVGSAYCVGVAALVLSGVLPQPADVSIWAEGAFPPVWWQNLDIALGGTVSLARDVFLLVVVPAYALRGSARRFVWGLGFAPVLLFMNPATGPLWIEAVTPAAYWRLVFLLPLPLCAGLALGALGAPSTRSSGGRALFALATAAALLGAFALDGTRGPSPEAFTETKSPFAYRLPPAALAFVRDVAPRLEGRNLLAPAGISWVAPLLVPGLRLEVARRSDTLHHFRNLGRDAEGRRRLLAWRWVGQCTPSEAGEAAARASIDGGVDAVVHVVCPGALATLHDGLFEGAPGTWREAARGHGFVLVLREP